MKFLLIAYKPSSDDYCRGCHMATYDSMGDHHVCDSLSELIDQIVYYESWDLHVNEEGFELTILDSNFEELSFHDLGIFDKVAERLAECERIEAEAKARQERERKEQVNRETRERELKELERLSRKYHAQ